MEVPGWNARPGPVRVLLVDDHPVVREGVRAMLAPDPDIEVAGEAGSGDEAVALARNGSYDVILMDLRMPGNRSRRRDRLARSGRPGDQDRGAHHV